MYRLTIHGPHAVAYFQSATASETASMMARLQAAFKEGQTDLPEGWEIAIEGQDAEGQWQVIAFRKGRRS